MPVLSPSAVRKQVLAGTPDRLYVILGPDEPEKSALAAEFDALVEPELRGFNVQRFFGGGDTTPGAVVDALRTAPFVSERRVVIVKEAEKLLEPRRESDAALAALAQLEEVIGKPPAHAVLVLVATSLNQTRRIARLLHREATVVTCSGLEDASDPRRYVQARFAKAGIEIDSAAVGELLRLAGSGGPRAEPDTARLRRDVERILMFATGRPRIGLLEVKELAEAEESRDPWAVTNAIGQGATGRALRELALALDGGAVPYMVLGQLAWFVREKQPRLNPEGVPAALDALFRTDVELKSSGGDPRVLLERLVVELCAAAGAARG
jgi:DNA polymerase-3 subunit delta